jgi:hypothetical protein
MSVSLGDMLGGAVDVDKEVGLAIRRQAEKPRSGYAVMEEIRQRVGDDDSAMREIEKKMAERYKRIKKLAEKIYARLAEKHADMTKFEMEEKLKEYKSKFNFDDDDLLAIRNLIWRREDRLLTAEQIEYSPMSRALGYVPTTHNFIGKLNVPSDEREQVRLIRDLNNNPQAKQIHNQVTLQSLMYNVTNNLYNASYDRFKTNTFSHVNPVLFAMFFDKIDCFDTNMILASIARIISQRDEGLDLETMPDYELYKDIATDPNESECVSTSNKPFTDLLARCNVQVKVWESVLQLRQGRYYVENAGLFIEALNSCKANVFDAGDLAYVRDEGTTMRKLMGVFSLRPTIVQTRPMLAAVGNIASVAIPTTTRVPMVQLRFGFNDPATKTYNLEDALKSEQHYISHKQIIAKTTQVIASNKILVIYVNRHHHSMNLGNIVSPYTTISLPLTVSTHEKVFEAYVQVSQTINNVSGGFTLKSVVSVVVQPINNSVDGTLTENLIMGTSANVILNGTNAVRYEPLCLAQPSGQIDGKGAAGDKLYPLLQTTATDVIEEAKTRGTVFIYTTQNAGNPLI